jgi:hypothetical protein
LIAEPLKLSLIKEQEIQKGKNSIKRKNYDPETSLFINWKNNFC